MVRGLFLAFGGVSHAMFLVVFLYMACFVGNFAVPKTIDAPATQTSLPMALAINALLLAQFAVPHSVMARPGFKKVWTRIIPTAVERSIYVLIANLSMILLLWQWRPITAIVWDVPGPVGRALMWTLFAAGWLLVPLASLMISHFDLFGTRQVWLNFRRQAYEYLPFHTPMLYKLVRHPLYVGWMIAFWATPTMTAGHLLFAAVLTVYMLVAIPLEERDLVNVFGEKYEEYRRRVPALVPRLCPQRDPSSPEGAVAEAVEAAR
jgi:protein-S-isoprenylcysteine O-methyltransferase Ste14